MSGTSYVFGGVSRKAGALTFAQINAALATANAPLSINGQSVVDAASFLMRANAASTTVGVAPWTFSSGTANGGQTLTLQGGDGQTATAGGNSPGGDVAVVTGKPGTGGTGSPTEGRFVINLGSHSAGAFETLGWPDFRFLVDPASGYFVFAANASGQNIYFQSLLGGVYLQAPVVHFSDSGIAAAAIDVTPASAGASRVDVATTVTSFTMTQTLAATGTGAPWSVIGQSVTTGTGGDLTIGPGSGSVANGAFKWANLATTTSSPSSGGAGALPTAPAGYASITINGTARKIAYY